jgi:hypothetical protein
MRAAIVYPDNGGEDVKLALPLFVGESQTEIQQLVEPIINHYLQTVAAIYRSAVERSQKLSGDVRERVERFGHTSYDQACESMANYDTPSRCVDWLREIR